LDDQRKLDVFVNVNLMVLDIPPPLLAIAANVIQ
jgi:hypothetical protein